MGSQVILSVVAPCFDEAAVLAEFHRRVALACRALPGLEDKWELVLVNDGSRDGTRGIVERLAWADPHVVAINLARNYGHQIALSAGLLHCRGERILVIDADLQDPPELLGKMMRWMDEQDADVVYGQRRARAGESRLKRLTASLFYRALRRLVEIDIPVDTGDFRLMNRRTLDVLNRMPERDRFIRGLVSWIGLRQVPLVYDRAPRHAGTSHYPFLKMARLALDAVTSFSVVPLRFASLAGAATGALGLLSLTYTVGGWLMGSVVTGWTSITTLLLIIGGLQLMMLGIIGEYLGRLYMESKHRPLFVIDSIIGAPARAAPLPTASSQVRLDSSRKELVDA